MLAGHAEVKVRVPAARVSRWVLLGVAAAGVELALLRALYEGLGWALPVATAVAAETLILVKFFIADRWIFGHARPAWDRLVKYHAACAGAFVVYWVVINGLSELFGVMYAIAFILG
ncbi:MAG TPA: GtrA family protein, partial [Chloroflexota bacterium]|nr:GtrA family protein [Chloroflexota bacterium]